MVVVVVVVAQGAGHAPVRAHSHARPCSRSRSFTAHTPFLPYTHPPLFPAGDSVIVVVSAEGRK